MLDTHRDQGGEFSAAIELRRIFPGILDNAKARYWGRRRLEAATAQATEKADMPPQDQIVDAVMAR